jgi:hypothetical protein
VRSANTFRSPSTARSRALGQFCDRCQVAACLSRFDQVRSGRRHPGRRSGVSLKYSQYSRSSRLAGWGPRRSSMLVNRGRFRQRTRPRR